MHPIHSTGDLFTQEEQAISGEFSPVCLDDLAPLPRWVAWREERRNGKPVKVPFSPHGGFAKSNDPSTWADHDKAFQRAGQIGGGLGFMLGELDGQAFGGVDLDSCLDPETGTLEPWAEEVIGRFASYAEVSPSGRGVKVFFRYAPGDRDVTAKTRAAFSRGTHCEIALDLASRYYAVTGKRLENSPAELKAVDRDTLVWLVEDAGPRFMGADAAAPDGSERDESRSGEAFRLAVKCHREGLARGDWEKALASDPDLAEWAKDARQVSRAWERASAYRVRWEDLFEDLPALDLPEETLDGFPVSEDGVALAFEARFRSRLRFDHSAGKWFEWTGSHWQREETKLAFTWARETCRAMARADPKAFAAKAMSKAASAAAVERFAQASRVFAVTAEHWDTDAWQLGTPGGTVNLRTGELHAARPDDHITRQTAVTPIPLTRFDGVRDCPRWLAFLREATGHDAGAIRFLQQWAGYTLTGDTREQALLFVHGPGGSGKSTAINTLGDLMGDYCVNVQAETLSASKFDRHSTELARLRGARMARASETEQGRAWAQQRIKALTGGDVITARFMRQDDFEFRPQFKLTIVGNHAPAIENVDSAMRRRFNVLPFVHPPAKVDPMLPDALRSEWPGILSWAIAGCLDWQANGLIRPGVITDATDAYFEQQDVFAAWLEDSCERDPEAAATAAALFTSWSLFARQAGEDPGSLRRAFPERMAQHGFRAIKDTKGIRGRGYAGLRICDGFAPEPVE
ncbi:MAG: phage/plasmid primase, P4 family [Glycocaulis sp.]